MTIEAIVVLDSKAPNGARLTTFQLTYPRFTHSELMTHRVFSRNAASSRAIPTPKKIERIRKDCARPSEWGVNQKGMQAAGPLSEEDADRAEELWLEACNEALHSAEMLCGIKCSNCNALLSPDADVCECGTTKLQLHKQVANRILEPFDHITTVVSTTKMSNHWKLRLEKGPDGRPMADPTYFELATKWQAAAEASTPCPVPDGAWHLPYVQHDTNQGGFVFRGIGDDDATGIWLEVEKLAASVDKQAAFLNIAKKVSVGRVARTSYMRQGQGDIAENVKLHDALSKNGHWSPFEPVATPIDGIQFVKFDSGFATCDFCHAEQERGAKGVKVVNPHTCMFQRICRKCALGHVTSGNFVGWHQYRKEFPGEAGGDD